MAPANILSLYITRLGLDMHCSVDKNIFQHNFKTNYFMQATLNTKYILDKNTILKKNKIQYLEWQIIRI